MKNLKKMAMLGFVLMSCASLTVAMIDIEEQIDPGFQARQLLIKGDGLGLLKFAKKLKEEGSFDGLKQVIKTSLERLDEKSGLSPLHIAASLNYHQALRAALGVWSPDVDVQADGEENSLMTPLHLAALQSAPEAIQELLKHNPSLTSRNFNDETPLDIAHRVARLRRGKNAVLSLQLLEKRARELGIDEPQREEDILVPLETKLEDKKILEQQITNVTPDGGSEGSLEGSLDDESLMKDGSDDPEYLRKRSIVKKAWGGHLGNWHNFLRTYWSEEAARNYILDEYEKLTPEQKADETVVTE